MSFEEESVNLTLPLIAMSMIDADSDKFAGLTFGVSALSADLTPQVRLALGTRARKFPHLLQAANNQLAQEIRGIAPHPLGCSRAFDCCLCFSLQIFLNQSFVNEPLPDADATISLPADLEDFFSPGGGNKTRIQFHFHGSQKLFQVHKRSLAFNIIVASYETKKNDFISGLNPQLGDSLASAPPTSMMLHTHIKDSVH